MQITIPQHCLDVLTQGVASTLRNTANAVGYHDDPPNGMTLNQVYAEFGHALALASLPVFSRHPDVREAIAYAKPTIVDYRQRLL